jgi:hypothetical protein
MRSAGSFEPRDLNLADLATCTTFVLGARRARSGRDRLMVSAELSYRSLFPSPYQIELSRLRQQLEQAHLAWVTEWRQRQADFKIENIRFNHDPHWNRRIFSLQAARDGEIWFWRATRAIVLFGDFWI